MTLFCFLFPSFDCCHLWDNWDQLSTLFSASHLFIIPFFSHLISLFKAWLCTLLIGRIEKKNGSYHIKIVDFFPWITVSSFPRKNWFGMVSDLNKCKTFAKTVWFLIRHRQWSSLLSIPCLLWVVELWKCLELLKLRKNQNWASVILYGVKDINISRKWHFRQLFDCFCNLLSQLSFNSFLLIKNWRKIKKMGKMLKTINKDPNSNYCKFLGLTSFFLNWLLEEEKTPCAERLRQFSQFNFFCLADAVGQ